MRLKSTYISSKEFHEAVIEIFKKENATAGITVEQLKGMHLIDIMEAQGYNIFIVHSADTPSMGVVVHPVDGKLVKRKLPIGTITSDDSNTSRLLIDRAFLFFLSQRFLQN